MYLRDTEAEIRNGENVGYAEALGKIENLIWNLDEKERVRVESKAND